MKRKHSILRATVGVTMLIILGKLLGFCREAIIAAFFGATTQTDAFFFAQGMPSMVFPAVGHSLALAFTSLYVTRISNDGAAADKYGSRMLNASILIGIMLGVAGILLSPIFVTLFAPGFKGEQLALAIRLTRFTMGAFALIVINYILSALLNSKMIFIGSRVAGLCYNLAIIVITVVLGRNQGVELLTLTVIAGALMQTLVLIICCRNHFQYSLRQSPIHTDTRELLMLAAPILLGNCVVQINSIVDKVLGSMLQVGALSSLSYSRSLDDVVISTFVNSLSTVLYPTLTTYAAQGDMAQFGQRLHRSLLGLSSILIPISCITVLCSTDIVTIVFSRGSFDQNAIALTSIALSCYAPRFVFAGIREVLTHGYFALKDTKTPMINEAIGVACNIVVSIMLVRYLGIAGIAIGTTVSAFVSAILLLYSVPKNLEHFDLKEYMISFGKQLVAGLALILALLFQNHEFTMAVPIIRFMLNLIVGAIVYFAALLVLRSKEAMLLMGLLKQRFHNK